MKRSYMKKDYSKLSSIFFLILLGLILMACGLLNVTPAETSTPTPVSSFLDTALRITPSPSSVETSAVGEGMPVLIQNYQLSLVDACNTLAYKSLYSPPIEEWTTAPNGYNFLFTYLMIQGEGNPSTSTPDLPKTAFSATDNNGRKYPATGSSIEGACNTEDRMHYCVRYGKPFNMLVIFIIPEKMIDQPWQFFFKDTKAFTFTVRHGSLCPCKDTPDRECP
jgi:hypothetical protein